MILQKQEKNRKIMMKLTGFVIIPSIAFGATLEGRTRIKNKPTMKGFILRPFLLLNITAEENNFVEEKAYPGSNS